MPKVVGELGNIIGEAGINIASLQLSREAKGGTALTLIEIDEPPKDSVVDTIRGKDFILEAKLIKIEPPNY